MIGLIISLVAGGGIAFGLYSVGSGTGWIVFGGIGGFLLMQLIFGLMIRFAMKGKQAEIQAEMMSAQEKINRQMTIFQRRPPSSMRAAQETMERIQQQAARRVLEIIDTCNPLCLFNAMLGRQLNAMRVQLHFQLREYKTVDALLPKSLLMDPQSLAIKLTRMYRLDDAGIDKFYRRKCSRAKGDAAALLTCTYAWIKLRQNDTQAAISALVSAKKRTDHKAVVDNYERLINGKTGQFNNSSLGDQWYALGLEEPKVKAQRQTRMY